MKKENFSKFKLYSSFVVLGVLSSVPCVNANETSSYTPAKLESDGVVSRYEIKTVVKYYDKVTGFSVNPEDVTDNDSYKIVEEKQLIPHFYSVVPNFNKIDNDSADTGVKYYQWGKSASTSHLLYEVSDKEYSDLTVFYTPSKKALQEDDEQQAVLPTPEKINSLPEDLSEISVEQAVQVKKLSRHEKKELKTEMKLQRQQKKAEAKAIKELKIQEKKDFIETSQNEAKEELKVKNILAKEKRKISKQADKIYPSVKRKTDEIEVMEGSTTQNNYVPVSNDYKVYQKQKINDKASVNLKNKTLNLLIPFQLKRQAPSSDKKIIKNLSTVKLYKNSSRTSNIGVLK